MSIRLRVVCTVDWVGTERVNGSNLTKAYSDILLPKPSTGQGTCRQVPIPQEGYTYKKVGWGNRLVGLVKGLAPMLVKGLAPMLVKGLAPMLVKGLAPMLVKGLAPMLVKGLAPMLVKGLAPMLVKGLASPS